MPVTEDISVNETNTVLAWAYSQLQKTDTKQTNNLGGRSGGR